MAAKEILIVEDERDLNEAYQIILKKNGYTVRSASDGKEALAITEETTPDLILLDLRMPNIDGLGFLRNYKKNKNHPEVKIVVFSNMDTKQDIDEAYELGADKYMLKAWASPNELLKLVEDIFSEKTTSSSK